MRSHRSVGRAPGALQDVQDDLGPFPVKQLVGNLLEAVIVAPQNTYGDSRDPDWNNWVVGSAD
eukprot:13259169-Alexandrium_andersonii.AAC.1